MLAYGIGNAANDGWGERVVTRGRTGWAIPSVLATWFGRDAERIGSAR